MAITRALEFDQTPNKLLFEIGEQAYQEQLNRMKLQMEERAKANKILDGLNPAILAKDYDAVVVNQSLPQIQTAIANFQKSGGGEAEARALFGNLITPVISFSNGRKQITENIEKTINLMGDKTLFDRGRLMTLVKDRALNKKVNGISVPKTAEELDLNTDWVQYVMEKEPDLAVDGIKASDSFLDYLKKIPEVEIVKEEEFDKNGRRIGTVDKEKLSFLYTRDANNNIVLKKDANDYVPEDVFNNFYSRFKPWVDSEARKIMAQSGVDPSNVKDFEIVKRAFVTKKLEENKSGSVQTATKNVKAPSSSSSTTVVNMGGQPYRKAYEELDAAVKAGKLSDVSPSITEYITALANKSGKRAKVGLKYTSDEIDVREVNGKLKLYDKSANEYMPITLNQKDFDQEYNKGAFGAQAAGNASGVNWK